MSKTPEEQALHDSILDEIANLFPLNTPLGDWLFNQERSPLPFQPPVFPISPVPWAKSRLDGQSHWRGPHRNHPHSTFVQCRS